MHETWYVLENGLPADPSEVAPDESGVLRNRDGEAVAMGPHGPRSRGMSADDIDKARAAQAPNDRQMKPAAGAKYKTR